MKVLFISPQPFFEWRGSSIRVRYDVTALAEGGFDVTLLTLPIGKEVPGLPVSVERVPRLPGIRKIAIGPSPAKLAFDVLLLAKGLLLAFRHRYQIIHGTEEAGFIAWVLSRLTGGRCVFEKHSDPGSYRRGWFRNAFLSVYQSIENFTARRADLVICTGEGLVSQVVQSGTEASVEHISDLPSSQRDPDPEEVDTVRRQLCDRSDEVLVTYVGSFALYQGIELLFNAVPLVLSASDRVRFVVIGGSEAEIAARRAELSEIADRVCFVGYVDPKRLPAYLAASDIVLAPRKAGVNTPLKILDYFKSGTAIVATDTPANRLLLDSGTAVFSAYEKSAFAQHIISLAQDPESRRLLGKNGRERYETTYTYERFKKKLNDAYKGMMRDHATV
jgi:glycosyltransferase involved in cell wall biosynthesis